MIGYSKLPVCANESCDEHVVYLLAIIEMTRDVHQVFALWR